MQGILESTSITSLEFDSEYLKEKDLEIIANKLGRNVLERRFIPPYVRVVTDLYLAFGRERIFVYLPPLVIDMVAMQVMEEVIGAQLDSVLSLNDRMCIISKIARNRKTDDDYEYWFADATAFLAFVRNGTKPPPKKFKSGISSLPHAISRFFGK